MVVEINKLHQKVCREAQRIHMFTRFQKTIEGSYYASYAPHVRCASAVHSAFPRPLCRPALDYLRPETQLRFFVRPENRFPKVVFDDLKVNSQNGQLHASLLAEDEKLFQKLWKQYFKSICIEERRNDKVHRQHLPKRFWKYLPEKGVLVKNYNVSPSRIGQTPVSIVSRTMFVSELPEFLPKFRGRSYPET